MKYYALAQIELTDPAWVADYVSNVTPMVEQHGGRYLARTQRAELLEGEPAPARESGHPPTVLIIEWPSREAAEAFYASEGYRPYRERRRRGSSGWFMLVAGEDTSGAARIAK